MRIRAALLAFALVLTGCAESTQEPIEQISAGVSYAEQQITWRACENGFECATVAVPADHLVEESDPIAIALIRKSGTSDLTPLLVNPGGPGASGVSYVRDNYAELGTQKLRENFQIIGFDPRGVGLSAPVTCVDIELKDQLLYGQTNFPIGSEQDLAVSKKLLEDFANSCRAGSVSLELLTTQQAARDLDIIRSALKQETLNFLGFSYGTELGATYIALHPDRVGQFVLDGAVDPTLSPAKGLVSQVQGFDNAFRSYLADCLASKSCPFSGSVESALVEVSQLLMELETSTLSTSYDREVGIIAALSGIFAALYSTDSWPYLTQAFEEALAGDGSTLLLLADFYNDRDPQGGYLSNINEANLAINCADERIEVQDYEYLKSSVVSASELFGKYFGAPELSCIGWPRGKSVSGLDFGVEVSVRPLVIGTTGDPATPYSQAVALSKLLDGAILLTYVGEGHTALGSSQCVDKYVEEFFLKEFVSSANLRCD